MKLLGSPRSPYAQKVRVILAEKAIACEWVEASPAGPEVAAANPLSKVPVLVRDDGRSLYDSSVIIEYLDGISSSPKLIPDAFEDRIEVKRWDALGSGILDAAVMIMHENRLPVAERKGAEFYDKQRKKIDAALATMEKDLGARNFCHGDSFSLADIACGSALVYLDSTLPDLDWRNIHPKLARLAERLGERASFTDA